MCIDQKLRNGSEFIGKQGTMVRLYHFPIFCVSLAVRNDQNFLTAEWVFRKQLAMRKRTWNFPYICRHFYVFQVLFIQTYIHFDINLREKHLEDLEIKSFFLFAQCHSV